MAAATTTEAAEATPTTHGTGHAEHPSDLLYFKIALVLALLTAIEVVASYVGLSTVGLMFVLFPIMIVKFAMVAAFFMHLKGDSRLFTRLFTTGVILAIGVYAIVFLAFDEFF
ncbi:MAG: cytochrome C oxidase subunit IV family protein [Actinomycetota bacterium]|nr:cytochrome C oxidase subunit IV family protein [Actinomycetota bacterium]